MKSFNLGLKLQAKFIAEKNTVLPTSIANCIHAEICKDTTHQTANTILELCQYYVCTDMIAMLFYFFWV